MPRAKCGKSTERTVDFYLTECTRSTVRAGTGTLRAALARRLARRFGDVTRAIGSACRRRGLGLPGSSGAPVPGMPSLMDRREHGAPATCGNGTSHRPPHRDGPAWVRHRRVRTRTMMERPAREAPRPGRSPQVRMTPMGARKPAARTARPARGAVNSR